MSLLEIWRDYWSPKEEVDTSPRISDEVKYTTCYMCACRCGIKVHLKDGGIRFIEGNPRHPVSVAAVTPSSRERVSRSSPRNSRSTAALLRWRDILPPRPSAAAPDPCARAASSSRASAWFV
jgi:hypothetical protein